MKLLNNIEEYLIVPIFSVMSIIVFVQVIFRFIIKASLPWSEELLRFLFIWGIVLGGSIGIKRSAHLGVDLFVGLVPLKVKKIVRLLSYICIAAFCVLMVAASYGLVMLQLNSNQLSPAMRVPMYVGTLSIPVGFSLMLVRVFQAASKELLSKPEGY